MKPFIEFKISSHQYFINGAEYVAVSRVLEHAGLISDFCRIPDAAQRGTDVHDLCHKDSGIIERLDMRTVPPKYRGYLKAWRAYRRDSGFAPAAVEEIVTCDDYKYAGRFDALGVLPGQPIAHTIIDLKTGAVPTYTRFQLSAYCFAFMPGSVFNRIGVQLKPDGTYNCKIFPVQDFFNDRAEWLSLVSQYHQSQKEKKQDERRTEQLAAC